MKRILICSILVSAIAPFRLAGAASCTPAKNANELAAAVQSGCSPITFDAVLANGTVFVNSQLQLKAGVTLDGEDRQVTLLGGPNLTLPMIRLSQTGSTVTNVTLANPGRAAVVVSGLQANDNAILFSTIKESDVGVYVVSGLRNRISQNSFAKNATGAILLKSGNGNLAAPAVTLVRLAESQTDWVLEGTGPANGIIELYAADPTPNVAPQGKTYLASLAIAEDGTFRTVIAKAEQDDTIPYTLLAIDAEGNTSPFSERFVPAEQEGYLAAADADGDGILNDTDNCLAVANPEQTDADEDHVGDACDNCASIENADQGNVDGDKMGDACDVDIDADGAMNLKDNCPFDVNPDQLDDDRDGVGDACDAPAPGPGPAPDTDTDAIPDVVDNCPGVANVEQVDQDGDGVGDACDEDLDGDTAPNLKDNCPYASNVDQADANKDGVGDACTLATGDLDDDADTIANGVDNCPKGYNPDQTDADQDHQGDACDADVDGDGVVNWQDNCPELGNPDQKDTDGDKVGDACKTPSANPPPPAPTPEPEGSPAEGGGCSLVTSVAPFATGRWISLLPLSALLVLGLFRRNRPY